MKEPTHARKGKTITDLVSGDSESYASVNKAKKESHKMTKAGSIVRRTPSSAADRRKRYQGALRP